MKSEGKNIDGGWLAAAALAAIGLVAPQPGSAQTATIYGSLGNFDVANNTGHDACGFEMQVDGLDLSHYNGAYSYQRYGAATTEAYPGGLFIRHKSAIDPISHTCVTKTVSHPLGQPFGGTCYLGSLNYNSSGCEHFGTYFNIATQGPVLMRWLAQDPLAPDTLIPVNPPVAVPVPNYYTFQPAVPGNPPQVEIVIEAPEPPEVVGQYGDAQWMRVFMVQLPREVTLDELLSNNPTVPQDLAQLESDWQIVQQEPPSNGNRTRSRHRNRGNLDPTTRTVVRRIEMNAFTGTYDPLTHEALCADLTCNVPSAGELGEQLSAQMTAVLVQSDSVTVTKSGNGKVTSADARISCGNKCVAPYDAGSAVLLTAQPGSDSVFKGWSGACAGAQLSCTVAANNHVDVSAAFALKDTDGDGKMDTDDNCTLVSNSSQLDADGDGYGNACDGDLNNSGMVTVSDFAMMRSVLNQGAGTSPTAAAADMNGSGTVTTADFALLRARLGTPPGPRAGATP